MQWLHDISTYISNVSSIKEDYIFRILMTVIVLIIISVIKHFCFKSVGLIKNNKKTYMYSQKIRVILNVMECVIVIFIWATYIRGIITLISFISAAFTIALRDLIFNFFSGVYIKVKKIFEIEDRIEINGFKGDVVNINALNFEVLEISDKEENGQSTGIIVTFPNSSVFSYPVKNYNKAFKYIWDELTVRVPLDCDLVKTKNELYKIVNNIDIIKAIPIKMKKQIHQVSANYRIYFNKFEPIIYTRVVKNCVELKIRYLIHPKKARYVESLIWNRILFSYHNKEIELYKDEV